MTAKSKVGRQGRAAARERDQNSIGSTRRRTGARLATAHDPSGMPEPPDLPMVALDEAGQTGEDLLNVEQPVFALAAVHLDADTARALVAPRLGGADELHFKRMRRSGPGRRHVVSLLEATEINPRTVRLSVMHKRYVVVAKLVDLLLEPAFHERGADFYAGGMAPEVADAMFVDGPRACGEEAWEALLSTFVAACRHPEPAQLLELLTALGVARARCQERGLLELLDLMPGTADELGVALASASAARRDVLEPLVATAVEQAGAWGERLGPFVFEHDESQALFAWAPRILTLVDPGTVESLRLSPTAAPPVLALTGMRPVKSHTSPAVQIADVVASASAYSLRQKLIGKGEEPFARDIARSGVMELIENAVWPRVQTL